jgi:hypothetical protein
MRGGAIISVVLVAQERKKINQVQFHLSQCAIWPGTFVLPPAIENAWSSFGPTTLNLGCQVDYGPAHERAA